MNQYSSAADKCVTSPLSITLKEELTCSHRTSSACWACLGSDGYETISVFSELPSPAVWRVPPVPSCQDTDVDKHKIDRKHLSRNHSTTGLSHAAWSICSCPVWSRNMRWHLYSSVLRNIYSTAEQTWALCTVLDRYTLSKTSLGWALRGTPSWIWSMWAQGLATSLYTHRRRQKGRGHTEMVVFRETFRQGESQGAKFSMLCRPQQWWTTSSGGPVQIWTAELFS